VLCLAPLGQSALEPRGYARSPEIVGFACLPETAASHYPARPPPKGAARAMRAAHSKRQPGSGADRVYQQHAPHSQPSHRKPNRSHLEGGRPFFCQVFGDHCERRPRRISSSKSMHGATPPPWGCPQWRFSAGSYGAGAFRPWRTSFPPTANFTTVNHPPTPGPCRPGRDFRTSPRMKCNQVARSALSSKPSFCLSAAFLIALPSTGAQLRLEKSESPPVFRRWNWLARRSRDEVVFREPCRYSSGLLPSFRGKPNRRTFELLRPAPSPG